MKKGLPGFFEQSVRILGAGPAMREREKMGEATVRPDEEQQEGEKQEKATELNALLESMEFERTERKKAEEALAKSEERALAVEEALRKSEEQRRSLEETLRGTEKMETLGTIAGGVARDLSNILATIIGNAELALGEVAEETPACHKLQRILRAGKQGIDVVKQVLAFSVKAEQVRIPIRLTPLVKTTFDLLRTSIPSGIKMRLTVECSQDSVLADPREMQQVLINLATNASEAMSPGGVMEISLTDVAFYPGGSGLSHGIYAALSVGDTGCGMTHDVLERIFEPFFTTKEAAKDKERGMGLSVVLGIVKSHGGDVTVHSEPGKGSVFTVLLPVEDAKEVREDAMSESGKRFPQSRSKVQERDE